MPCKSSSWLYILVTGANSLSTSYRSPFRDVETLIYLLLSNRGGCKRVFAGVIRLDDDGSLQGGYFTEVDAECAPLVLHFCENLLRSDLCVGNKLLLCVLKV